MFSHSVKIAFYCLVSVLAAGAEEDDAGRIVGGQLTTIDKVPYLVQLRERNTNRIFCGGTIITPTHIATAAHCVDKKHPDNILVVAGASTIFETGQQRTLSMALMHPWYNKDFKFNFDVAILVLSNPLTGPTAKTMALPTQDVRPNEKMQVSGWGLTFETGASPSPQVRTVVVPILGTSQCEQQYGYGVISQSMFCASIAGTHDSCSGDSGGPAIVGNQLAGIVSWGVGCARADSPGVYTNVYSVLQFIQECLKY